MVQTTGKSNVSICCDIYVAAILDFREVAATKLVADDISASKLSTRVFSKNFKPYDDNNVNICWVQCRSVVIIIGPPPWASILWDGNTCLS